MSTRRVNKQALINQTITFSKDDAEPDDGLRPGYAYNFIDIVTLDGLDGDSCSVLQGEFEVFVKTDELAGFKSIPGGGTLKAVETGGDKLPDGKQKGLVFVGVPIEIKIVPKSVNCSAYRVFITQLSNQLDKLPDSFVEAFDPDSSQSLNVSLKNTDELQTALNQALFELRNQNEEMINLLTLLNLRFEEAFETRIFKEDLRCN